MYRPQFPFPAAPDGFVWQPCVYQFDQNNVPALGSLVLLPGQVTGHIPLPLDKDAPFVLMAIRVQNTPASLLLFDPWSNQLMDDFVPPQVFASNVPPSTVLEYPIHVPSGALFAVRFQGQ